jgi:hypothetical protein
MGVLKGKSEGGSGGKRGHSNMDHWVTTEELKSASRKRGRLNSKRVIREETAVGASEQREERTFVISFGAHPSIDHPSRKRIKGAYITAWVVAASGADAGQRAESIIRSENWQITERHTPAVVTAADYANHPDSLQFFNEAQASGASLVFDTWTDDE